MTRLNVFAITLAMLLCSSAVPSHAQDRSSSAWTGCYLGGHAGYGTGKSEPKNFGTLPDNKPDGFIGGGQIGCDYQFASSWLFGVQGDFSGADLSDSGKVFDILGGSESFKTRADWLASIIGRFGYFAGPWLIYGKAGAAWVRNNLQNISVPAMAIPPGSFFNFTDAATFSGYTVGGGIEYAFAPNWSSFVEYNFYDFGTNSVTLRDGSFGIAETFSLKQSFSVVKIGLNYRFGH